VFPRTLVPSPKPPRFRYTLTGGHAAAPPSALAGYPSISLIAAAC
jgi:hypothetical protein